MERNIVNKSCSGICVDPETYFHPYPNPKIAHLDGKKAKKFYTKIRSKSKDRIGANMENKICSAT